MSDLKKAEESIHTLDLNVSVNTLITSDAHFLWRIDKGLRENVHRKERRTTAHIFHQPVKGLHLQLPHRRWQRNSISLREEGGVKIYHLQKLIYTIHVVVVNKLLYVCMLL